VRTRSASQQRRPGVSTRDALSPSTQPRSSGCWAKALAHRRLPSGWGSAGRASIACHGPHSGLRQKAGLTPVDVCLRRRACSASRGHVASSPAGRIALAAPTRSQTECWAWSLPPNCQALSGASPVAATALCNAMERCATPCYWSRPGPLERRLGVALLLYCSPWKLTLVRSTTSPRGGGERSQRLRRGRW
jgi:hypothetical protein